MNRQAYLLARENFRRLLAEKSNFELLVMQEDIEQELRSRETNIDKLIEKLLDVNSMIDYRGGEVAKITNLRCPDAGKFWKGKRVRITRPEDPNTKGLSA